MAPSTLSQEDVSKALDLAFIELQRWGPLPTGWYIAYEYSEYKPKAESASIHYRRHGDDTKYTYHPFEWAFEAHYPDVTLPANPPRPTVSGEYHPPQFQPFDWFTHYAHDGFLGAIRMSVSSFYKAVDRKAPFHNEIRDRLVDIKHAYDTEPLEYPSEMYHPLDRPAANGGTQEVPDERDAAVLARGLGFSLVVGQTEDTALHDYFDPEVTRPNFNARRSLGEHYELFPPLYVACHRRSWYVLEFKRPKNTQVYRQWGVNANDWEVKAQALRHAGYDITSPDFMYAAIRVQRFIRAGFPQNSSYFDAFICAYSAHTTVSTDDSTFLTEWHRKPRVPKTQVVTLEWITNAIACSDNAQAKALAEIGTM